MTEKDRKKAIALSYSKEESLAAPIISAKGEGRTAEAIISKAKEHGIPVKEDKSLAQLLSAIDLNAQIPPELYQVVAEILVFVYKMEQKVEK